MQPEVASIERSRNEVADVLRKAGTAIENWGLNTWQLRTLYALKKCRTASLGGHIDGCDSCGNITISYNSCRNRHCPKCQGNKREDWIQARSTELLPVPYFHVVFTLPDSINALATCFTAHCTPRCEYRLSKSPPAPEGNGCPLKT